LRQAIEKEEALVVGRTVLALSKVIRRDPLRIVVFDELRLQGLVCDETGWSWTIANSQVIFQGYLFAVVTFWYAWADAPNNADTGARGTADRIAFQRDSGTVNRYQR
jgi:hypothetical protein